ncbi:MAG TPA: GAF domain-containing protein, partial [Gaiellaceae bacterium]|nr:GAF domain-containing protein [Gaiellaceae bacterium]
MGRENADHVQGALYRIAELASAAEDMPEFYRAIHEVVGELMPAQNLFIALWDEQRQLINWPYHVDETGTFPDPNKWYPLGEGGSGRGTTAYVLRTGEPQLISLERFDELVAKGELDLVGPQSEDWLGVPLKAEGATVGVLVVQSYSKDVRYTEQDRELLAFVGQHVGSALARARAIEETRQRNAELALINSVQSALAGELELQAIYDAVGERIRDVFDAQAVGISMLDEATGLMHDRYFIERGERIQSTPWTPSGFTKEAMETRESLLVVENLRAVAERFGSDVLEGSEEPKSVLFVPLVVGGKATGVVSLQNVDREHAFSESDLQLLETLAGSLSVALENARLVHETRQRNAELALINSVQEALAGELEMQAIYDVVGDKIQEIFDAQVVDIGIYDFTAELTRYPYTIERGVRFPDEPTPIENSWANQQVLATKAPVLINDIPAHDRKRGVPSPVVQGEPGLSVLFTPLISGDEVRGRISLQNLDRTNAFTENDVRLLTTLAGSLSVALENARLVHETRQRNAELALINSVQDALAGELELQAIYDAVGNQIRDVFDAQVLDIGMYDEATGLIHFPYTIERGERLLDEPIELLGFRQRVMETRESLRIDEDVEETAASYGNPVLSGEMPKSVLYVPLASGGKPTGVISLQNIDREHAFSDSDQQLLETLAASLSVALENARLVHETRQRNAELALINSVQDAIAGELDPQAIYDVVGDKLQEVFDAQVVDIAVYDE